MLHIPVLRDRQPRSRRSTMAKTRVLDGEPFPLSGLCLTSSAEKHLSDDVSIQKSQSWDMRTSTFLEASDSVDYRTRGMQPQVAWSSDPSHTGQGYKSIDSSVSFQVVTTTQTRRHFQLYAIQDVNNDDDHEPRGIGLFGYATFQPKSNLKSSCSSTT